VHGVYLIVHAGRWLFKALGAYTQSMLGAYLVECGYGAAIGRVDGTVTRIDTYTRQPRKNSRCRVCMGISDAD
jgi:hypothetical protein